jgi:hypothetical protein
MTQNRRLKKIVISVMIILSIPLIAMQFTNEVNWELSDFIIAGILLLGTGLICEFIMRKVKTKENRIALCLVVITILLLVWAELAVGIIGSPLAGS